MAVTIIKGPLGALLGIVYGFVAGIMLWYLPGKDSVIQSYMTCIILVFGIEPNYFKDGPNLYILYLEKNKLKNYFKLIYSSRRRTNTSTSLHRVIPYSTAVCSCSDVDWSLYSEVRRSVCPERGRWAVSPPPLSPPTNGAYKDNQENRYVESA